MDTHASMVTTTRDSTVPDARRAALRAWIDTRFAGSQAAYIEDARRRRVKLNQSEISQLLGSKSFGEKKARTLEQQSGMPDGYLVHATGTSSPPAVASTAMQLLTRATPRSRKHLEAIIEAANTGRLTDADVDLLGAIAQRFAKP